MSFDQLGLSAELLRAIREQGYTQPTPIQLQAIPPVLAGRDVLAGAQTGTGKTAAFTLPLLQRLDANRSAGGRARVRALVLTPTRELAAQVGDSFQNYGAHLQIRPAIVYGGVSINPQIAALRKGADVVIATPGRLLDHVSQRTIDLSGVEILVLDEADRMLDMGFIRDIRKIIALLPGQRQNLLFSATFSPEIRRLATDLLNDPAEIQVAARNVPADRISQTVWLVDGKRKRELLSQRIGAGNWRQVLVFTRTKHGADRLSKQLIRDGLVAAAIHGNKSQGARTRALADFKDGRVRVLVATDVAARGLDIDRLPYVVNFDLPNVPEDYIHRIGRTARAGNDGHAVSLVSPEEMKQLAAIERLLNRRLERETVPGYEPGSAGAQPRHSEPAAAGAQSRRSGPTSTAAPARRSEPGSERAQAQPARKKRKRRSKSRRNRSASSSN